MQKIQVTEKKPGQSKENWINPQMRLYIIKTIINSGREIKCDQCGSYNNIEFHHTKYSDASIKDLQLLCAKCHNNNSIPKSVLSTIFENGKRFCLGSNFKFEY